MKQGYGKAIIIIAIAAVASARSGFAQCKGPTSEKRAEISTFVMKKYQVASSANLTLISDTKANESCYWKFEYRVTPSEKNIAVFLSPDGQYLLPAIYDIKSDPLAEIRAQHEATMKQLKAGTLMQTGAVNGKVQIVEFSDFECPFCKRLTDVLEKEVMPKEGGQVDLVFRNFPLPMHPWARQAAEMAECAALQNQASFWAMHDFLFQNQQTLTPTNLKDQILKFAVGDKNLDQKQFASCVDMSLGMGPVAKDQQMGQTLGIKGTPTFWVNGVRFEGMRSAAELETIIGQAANGELIGPPEETNPVTASPRPPSPTTANACAPTVRGGTASAQ